MTAFIMAQLLALGAAGLPQWTFTSDMEGWVPNAHLANTRTENGSLIAEAVGWDPMLIQGGLEFPATAWQYVAIRISASKPGYGELFWTGETGGEQGGFSQQKSARFEVKEGTTQDVIVYPFWQAEGTIRQLRLDLYEGARFGIENIEVGSWGNAAFSRNDVYAWDFLKDDEKWKTIRRHKELLSPPLDFSVDSRGWAVIELASPVDGIAEILWATPGSVGAQTEGFPVKASEDYRNYYAELQGNQAWKGKILALGLRLPDGARVKSFRLAETPDGPGELTLGYFGFENAIPRAGREAQILVQFLNTGGKATDATAARLVLPADMKLVESTMEQAVPALERGAQHELRWRVQAGTAGEYDLMLGYGKLDTVETKVTFSEAARAGAAAYVPQPNPIYTPLDVCAYYFPGWDAYSKWECIRTTAPIRKPALGYYNEGNPECVDWQIKWAVENAISCFLVDWYWSEGNQHLTHWFEAYRQARYRDMLKVAIMWANHNAPGTHSVEDFRKVTREWIDRYFNLPAYFRINGKPAVFIWAPGNIRADLKGSEAVRKSMDEAQEMARQAGYPGITFVAMGYDFSKENIEALTAEGYSGVTTYHEWGAAQNAQGPRRVQFEEVVKTVAQSWAEKNAAAGGLTYYPVVDTGWDSRPWHGDKSLVIEGRTPALFYQLLQGAWQFAVNNDKKIVILGPLNEWGEGSYIEPCVEFGFQMYEAVRSVLAPGGQYPPNIAPSDLGRGPYDYPAPEPASAWLFDGPDSGWKAMMGVSTPANVDSSLKFKTTSDDPALMATAGVRAEEFGKALVTMQLSGPLPEGAQAQLFWASNAAEMTADTSTDFPLERDGQMHTYTVALSGHPRWRGKIGALRFDPCNAKDVEVALEEFRLEP